MLFFKRSKTQTLNTKKEILFLDENVSIHNTFSWAFFVMQVFGFMPIQGIFKQNYNEIGFKWISFRTLYSVLTLIGLLFMTLNQTARFFLYRVTMEDVQRIWYFLRASLVSLFFFSMARNWVQFLQKWQKVDQIIKMGGKPLKIRRKVIFLLIFFVSMFAVDYTLDQLQRIQQYTLKAGVILNRESWDHYQKYHRFKYVYQIFPYDFFSGICCWIVHLQVLFCGTFLDLFIMITSMCLAARMKLISNRIKQISSCNNVPECVWINIREDYNRLEILCSYVNSKIGYGIFICFIGNLGIILIQLYNNLRSKGNIYQKSYLYYAFIFLFIKTVTVCILGSKINDESKKPLIYLYGAEDSATNVEIDRLIRQISRGNMALSGLKFFQIRRSMILQIAGSIVTYELVFIELAEDLLKEAQFVNRTSSL